MPPALFAHPRRGASVVVEGVAYQTEILQAYGGSEQRIGYRELPDLSLRLDVEEPGASEAQKLRELYAAEPEAGYYVPWWPFTRRLDSQAEAGATTLQVALTGVPDALQEGVRRFVLWRSALDTEIVTASARGESSLTLSAPLQGAWAAGVRLMPLLLAYAEGQSSGRRARLARYGGTFSFLADLTECALAAGPEIYDPAAYLGLDVLTAVWHGDGGGEPWSRRVSVVEADAGRRVYDSQDAAGGFTRTLEFRALDSTEALAVRRFLAARLGRLRPFWLPSWDRDLTLAAPAVAEADGIDVIDAGYTELLFPLRARRHLAIRLPSGAIVYREVGAVEVQGGGVSTLTFLGSTLPEALPAGAAVSFLRHCRLADDLTEFSWRHVGSCDVTLRAQELPVDAPTGVTS